MNINPPHDQQADDDRFYVTDARMDREDRLAALDRDDDHATAPVAGTVICADCGMHGERLGASGRLPLGWQPTFDGRARCVRCAEGL